MGAKMDRANIYKGSFYPKDLPLTESELHHAYTQGNLQCFIASWRERTFGKVEFSIQEPGNLISQIGRMHQEIVELLVECTKMKEALGCHEEASVIGGLQAKLAKELADSLVTMFNVADAFDIDLMCEVFRVMMINLTREWKITGPGVGQHIKKSPYETGEKKL